MKKLPECHFRPCFQMMASLLPESGLEAHRLERIPRADVQLEPTVAVGKPRQPPQVSSGRPGIGTHRARASMCAACQPFRSWFEETVLLSARNRRSANDSIGVRPARISVIRPRHRRGVASSPNRAPSKAPATAPFVSVSPPASMMLLKVRSKLSARQYANNPISNVSSVYPIDFPSARTSAISATDASRTAWRTASGTCAP